MRDMFTGICHFNTVIFLVNMYTTHLSKELPKQKGSAPNPKQKGNAQQYL